MVDQDEGTVKVKVKLPLHFFFSTKQHATKAYWVNGGIAPLILLSQH
jgi:hypothetical protein